ncbi:MAG: transporter [Firmicutes bacterium]|nr:transporter [Bacillota bacterium]
MQAKAGQRTLLASVLLSSPGPLILGIALLYGRSSTQIADFIRRTAEFLAILVSWLVFRVTVDLSDSEGQRKHKLEQAANYAVGVAMCLSGSGMIFLALFAPHTDKGNVIPGLIIAGLGLIANSWFWLRYRKLNFIKTNAILAVQSRLYLAKTLVDTCVTLALLLIVIAPAAPFTHLVDLGGSIIVAIYLITNGVIVVTK